MKKYKILKWLVLFTAVFAVICFFTPFLDYNADYGYAGSNVPESFYTFFNELTARFGLYFGFHFIIGNFHNQPIKIVSGTFQSFCNWGIRFSLLMAVVAVILSVISFTLKDKNGFNKNGKIHWHLIVSIALSLISALLNAILMFVLKPSYDSVPSGDYNDTIRYNVNVLGLDIYSFIGLIPITVATIATTVLMIMSKREIINLYPALQSNPIIATTVSSPTVASTSTTFRQTATASGRQKSQIKIMEDKPMTKKEAEGLLAYIWVQQYNTLPFNEALDKIMAYLVEQKYVITPEMEAELSKTVGASEDVTGEIPAPNNKDLRHAREARLAKSWEEAQKYYERVRDDYPDFDEARFYYPYCKLLNTPNKDFLSVFLTDFAKIMSPLAKSVPQSNMSVEEQKELALAMISDLGFLIKIGKEVARTLGDSTRLHMDYRIVTEAICDIGLAFEEAYAGDTELLKATALVAFKTALDKIDKVKAYKALIDKYVAGIQRYEADFPYPKLHTFILPSKTEILSNILKK